MASEVDRLLTWMRRVEQLEDELRKANPAAQDLLFAQLVPAQRAQTAAFEALIAAAHRGCPEALVALDALETEIEEKTWTPPGPLSRAPTLLQREPTPRRAQTC
jgi:hypothetical protein